MIDAGGLAIAFRSSMERRVRTILRLLELGDDFAIAEAAEKLMISRESDEKRPSAAEASTHFVSFTARPKPCPFKTITFSAAGNALSLGCGYVRAGQAAEKGRMANDDQDEA